ncbi:3609_t:CDS:2, partial [Entrophospora sp. SA101]
MLYLQNEENVVEDTNDLKKIRTTTNEVEDLQIIGFTFRNQDLFIQLNEEKQCAKSTIMKFRAIVLHPSTSSILLSQSIISSSTSSTSTSSILLSQSITSLSSSPESTSTPPYQPTPVVLEQISNKYNCILCGKWLKSKITLRNHENKYHKFNKIIPHFSVLSSSNNN